jgi:flagellar hook-associated protein 1 FlgK
MEPINSQRYGSAFYGAGIGVKGVTRLHDRVVETRMRDATTRLASLIQQNTAYSRLETALDTLSDRSIGVRMSEFFNAANAMTQNPQEMAARRTFLQQSQALSETLNANRASINDARAQTNGEIGAAVGNINRISREVADLNDQIMRAEVGGTINAQANDLRDRRDLRLRALSELVDMRVIEQKNGSVDVVTGGGYLVRNHSAYELETEPTTDRGVVIHELRFAESGQAFRPTGGTLGGMLEARDKVLPQFLGDLDRIARALITAANLAHSTGSSLTPMRSVQSQSFAAPHALGNAPLAVNGVAQRAADNGSWILAPELKGYPGNVPGGTPDFFKGAKVLFTSGERAGESAVIREYDPVTGKLGFEPPLGGISAGDSFQVTSLEYPVKHGSFELVLSNAAQQTEDRFNIELDLDGLPTPPATDDTTLQELVADINDQLAAKYGANPPVAARITQDMRLELVSTHADVSFRFESDTSGFLAAAGINTLFTGRDAGNIAVRTELLNSPDKLALSASGLPGDNGVALQLAGIQSAMLLGNGSATLEDYFQGMVGALGVQAAEARELAENQGVVLTAIENERAAISGVNLDEEAVALITHQRAFQAAARYLAVVDELMATLMQSL